MRDIEHAFRAQVCRERAVQTASPFLRQQLLRLARNYDRDERLLIASFIMIAETQVALSAADLALRKMR